MTSWEFPPTRRSVLTAAALALAPRSALSASSPDRITGDFQGTRPDPFDRSAKNKGEIVHRARSGQTYSRIQARDFGNGLIRVAGEVDGLTVEDVEAHNFYRLIEGEAGASLTNFTVRRVKGVGFERSLSRLRGASRNGLFQDVYADSEAQIGDPFAVAFHLDENCSDITYERCTALRCQTPLRKKVYRQGDGFSDEGGCSGISYIDTLAQECTDAGYDIKSKGVRMVRAKSVSNRRNFRLWADATLDHIVSENPRGVHISTHGKGPRIIRIERLEVRSDTGAPVFYLEAAGGSKISIGSYDIQIPERAPLVHAEGMVEIDWGPQGPPRPPPQARRKRRR
jgi:hypothetical protein